MKLVDSNGKPVGGNDETVQSRPIESNIDRLKPRQTATGVVRGQQTLVSDTGTKMVQGNVPDRQNTFGITFYDGSGKASAFFGYVPGTAEPITIIAKEGYDVFDALNS